MNRNQLFFKSMLLVFSLWCVAPLTTAENRQGSQDFDEAIEKLEKEIEALKAKTKKNKKNNKRLSKNFKEFKERLTINGFLSAGLSQSNRDRVYNGASNDLTTLARGKMGLQTSFSLDDRTDAVVQLLARADSDDWNAKVEWAYLSRELSNRFTFRVGRLRLPVYLYSEVLEIGYSYPWVTPPFDAYNSTTFSNYDGFDLTYIHSLNEYSFKHKFYYGNNHTAFDDTTIDHQDLFGFDTSVTGHNTTFRIGYGQTNVDYDLGFLDEADSVDGTFTSIGMRYDDGDWLVISEGTRREVKTFVISDIDGYYLTVGYRFGDYLPYFTFSQDKTQDDSSRQTFTTSEALDAFFAGDDSKFRANAIAGVFNARETSYIVGVRREFSVGLSAKFELSYINDFKGTDGRVDEAYDEFGLPVIHDYNNVITAHFVVDAVF